MKKSLLGVLCLGIALLISGARAHAQTAAAEHLVVTAEPLPSAYGAPTSFSQSRFSPLTNAYVLPPGPIYAGLIYEDDVVHYRHTHHHRTQEVEIGLPYPFNIVFENHVL